ncbi:MULTISPECIES: JAB domain-containing protein [unclassified Serratia (in: enterobacteria)]|uniref:JAB domain-containing protein n=1 Tax=unclassified Serratia (in: enterobacteria) TaxID=2647522 RepID=UPI0006903CE1|nr:MULTISPECIES: JAB domain-containing protein [unclassified Serratia (in: enterobacteria)]
MEIRLGKNDKRTIEGTNDVYGIMQRILLRENKIDQEKEHLWMIGMNEAGYILYIELVALGTFRAVNIEPMNVFRIAVMKNASRVIAIHNHPSGSLKPSEADLDMTDRLIQVGRILNIEFMDHLIITPITYLSFRGEGIMDKLEVSLKYVPTYQIIESIRKEERKIAREKLELEKGKTKAAKEAAQSAKQETKAEREQKETLIHALIDKDVSIEAIAKILDITSKAVEKIINKK